MATKKRIAKITPVTPPEGAILYDLTEMRQPPLWFKIGPGDGTWIHMLRAHEYGPYESHIYAKNMEALSKWATSLPDNSAQENPSVVDKLMRWELKGGIIGGVDLHSDLIDDIGGDELIPLYNHFLDVGLQPDGATSDGEETPLAEMGRKQAQRVKAMEKRTGGRLDPDSSDSTEEISTTISP